jgi:GntR family transcriptional regulator/MocR family aminotransferase
MVGGRSTLEAITPTTLQRRRSALDVPLNLDRAHGNRSLQVHASLRAAILDGRLVAGLRLPSSRDLAAQLAVRRNAIVGAYEHLHSDGLIEARIGDGTYVAAHLPPRPGRSAAAPVAGTQAPGGIFALGHTHTEPQLLRRLASAVRRRITSATAADLGYGDPRGSEALRRQIAITVAASRGIRCDASCIFIVNGTQQGLRLCADALLRPGDLVWMEDPGYPATRTTLSAAGLRPVPVRVDEEGLDVAAGKRAEPRAKAVYVTPSHQFPTGVTMRMERRIALLAWARNSGAWVLEDDYDSEFRYAGPPLTALAGIDGGDRVIYIGTFSKTLFAGLRLAYLVMPPAAVQRVMQARAAHDRFPQSILGDAVADLMACGALATHIRRMRARYRLARDAVAQTLQRTAGGSLRVVVPGQGLHMLAYLRAGLPRDAASRIRAIARIDAWLVSETRMVRSRHDGFVLGFSGHDLSELTAAAHRLGLAARGFEKNH